MLKQFVRYTYVLLSMDILKSCESNESYENLMNLLCSAYWQDIASMYLN